MTTPSQNNENYESSLQKLATRLLTHHWEDQSKSPLLLVGKMPTDLPFSLPLPQDSDLLGTLTRGSESLEIVFDAPLSAEHVLQFYREQMPLAGWNEPAPTMEPHEGGFVHSDNSSVLFCKGSRGPSVNIIVAADSPLSHVRAFINLSRRDSPCLQRQHRHDSPMRNLIPALKPPVGVQQMGGGGGWSDDSANTSATLTGTDLSVAALASHYATQLEQAGWIRFEEGQSGPLAWTSWTFRDEDENRWNGLFFVLKVPGITKQYNLDLKIHIGEE